MTNSTTNTVEVTKERFFEVIGPLNVYLRSEREATYWETPQRLLVGVSTPGYMCTGPKTFRLNAERV